MFQWTIELIFFDRTISNDKKVEKEVKIQREAVQFADGAGQKLRMHRGESQFNCCGCVRESKIKKNSRKVAQWVNLSSTFTVKLLLISIVKSLCYGNFI